jgi:hypothetical protein
MEINFFTTYVLSLEGACDYWRGFGLDVGFIDHLYTQHRTASSYRALADRHALLITAHAKSFLASRSLVTVSNIGDSSASSLVFEWRLPSNWKFSSQTPTQNSLGCPIVFPQHGPSSQHRSFSYANRFRGNVFTEPFPSSGRIFLLIKKLQPSNGHRSVVCFVAVA